MNYYYLWYAVGLILSYVAIYCFRRDGRTVRKGELYLAIIMPFFGPVLLPLIIIDLFRQAKRSDE